ncbi:MAG: phage integrase N-terminal SAM-like domain-containing protein [Pirellulales bacterium]|nr:phage integrase N-terminal SAM-like domain-containing protein [Pirellulales bacterium]
MSGQMVSYMGRSLGTAAGSIVVPAIIQRAGEHASRRFLEFFAAQIRNPGTRRAYFQAVDRFCHWCDHHHLDFADIEPLVIATYIEQLTYELSAPTVKLHLAAIRMLYDWLVTGQVVPFNPAASVRARSMSL